MPRTVKKNETDFLHALMLTEESEREDIAKHIHQANTLLSLVKMNMKKAARNAGNKKVLEQIEEENYKALDESMQIISQSVRELSPPMFSRIGFAAALAELCRRTNLAGKKIQFEIKSHSVTDLAPQRALQLYRLCKELLEYLISDAGASGVQITLGENGKKAQLCFDHDGRTVEIYATTRYSMQARAILAGAQLVFGKENIQIKINHGKKN